MEGYRATRIITTKAQTSHPAGFTVSAWSVTKQIEEGTGLSSAQTPLQNFFCRKGSDYLNMKLAASLTLGIFFFFLPFGRSPRLKKVSSGLLGVEGGLILEGDTIPSRLSFLVSSSLKFLLSEFCRKKAGLDNNCCEGKEEKKDK